MVEKEVTPKGIEKITTTKRQRELRLKVQCGSVCLQGTQR